MSNKLYVGNLSYSVRDEDLQQQFSSFGHVQSAKVMMEPQMSDQLIHHSDRGSLGVSIRYTERQAEACIESSSGSLSDSYGNTLAETINGL